MFLCCLGTSAFRASSLIVLLGVEVALAGAGRNTSGTVVDPHKLPVVGLTVTAVNTVTNVRSNRQTDNTFESGDHHLLFPHLNVAQTLAFGRRHGQIAGSFGQEKVRATASLLAIDHLLHRSPYTLSGGGASRRTS